VAAPPDFNHVSVVTFDAGGTLLLPHPSVGAVYREIALLHGRNYPAAVLDIRFRAAFHAVSKGDSVPDPEARERDFWRRVVLATLSAPELEPIKNFDLFFAELWESFAHASRWREIAGAGEMLRELKRRGYRLGIISNWDKRLHSVLEETGLQALFEIVVISTEATSEKPDVAIFRTAETAFGVAPEQCLHIGDSRKHDIVGARTAGWSALLVRHDNDPAVDGEVGQLNQIPDLLPTRSRLR
jgi:putative hydrolase of the HAD superfamily